MCYSKLVKNLHKTFTLNALTNELNNVLQDAQYTCQLCFLSDLDQFNPIVFCGTCSLGAH
jgi:hypothetical protein